MVLHTDILITLFLKFENSFPEKAILLIDNAPSHPGEQELVSGGITSQISSTKRNPTAAAYGPGSP